MKIEWQDTPYGPMSKNLKSERLATLCEVPGGIQTGPFGSQLHQEDYVESGTPIITVEHLGDNRIVHENLPQVSNQDLERLKKYKMQTGDVIFSRVGSVDRRSLVRDEENGWLFSGRCLRVRPDPQILDGCFLSYFFGMPTFKEYIRKIAVGATMPSLNTEILSNIPIYFPPLPEQKAIARILGSLDDKIELNRRMNATLEAIAQALFRAWFVDFEPVKAKAAGLQPVAMDVETAALFPSEFEESEIGIIPKGWHAGTLKDVCETRRETVQPSEVSTDIAYVGLEHVPQKSIALTSWGSAGQVDSTKSRFRKNDILFGKLRPYFHKVVVAPLDGICSTDILVLNPRETHDFSFLLAHASSTQMIDYATRLSNGAKMPRIGWKDVAEYKVALPPLTIRQAFNDLVQSSISKIDINIFESQSLAEIRDALLPRLISGQISLYSEATSKESVV